MLNLPTNDGRLLKPWPSTHDSEETADFSMTNESDPGNTIAHLRSHKSMGDLPRVSPPFTQDEIGATSNPVRRLGKRARFKAWLKRTFLPERSPRPTVRMVEEPLSSLTTLVERDESIAVPTTPLHPSYCVLVTVGKDLVRIDKCIS
jgi:hypothetical protein